MQDLRHRIEETRQKHEFITFLILDDPNDWRCGVVQNSNNRFISFYDLSKITAEESRERFLKMADNWWWQSGQKIPIDLYVGKAFDEFQHALTTLPRKSLCEDPIGPTYSITEHYLKRVKKKRVELITRRAVAS